MKMRIMKGMGQAGETYHDLHDEECGAEDGVRSCAPCVKRVMNTETRQFSCGLTHSYLYDNPGATQKIRADSWDTCT